MLVSAGAGAGIGGENRLSNGVPSRASGLGWQPVAIASQPLTPRPSTSTSVSPRHASFYAVSSQYEQNKA